jgi:hypothetical protein
VQTVVFILATALLYANGWRCVSLQSSICRRHNYRSPIRSYHLSILYGINYRPLILCQSHKINFILNILTKAAFFTCGIVISYMCINSRVLCNRAFTVEKSTETNLNLFSANVPFFCTTVLSQVYRFLQQIIAV